MSGIKIVETRDEWPPQVRDLYDRVMRSLPEAMHDVERTTFEAAEECGVARAQAMSLLGEILAGAGIALIARSLGVPDKTAKRVGDQAIRRIGQLAQIRERESTGSRRTGGLD